MSLPDPTWQITVPSVHDGLLLDCRVYHPTTKHIQGAAVFAHPYAPLGGCMDDPVVRVVAAQLLQCSMIVGLFNFRGAGGSPGRTSWTGDPELADFESAAGFIMHYSYLSRLRIHSPDSAERPLKVVLGGYSFGSMIAARLSGAEIVLKLYTEATRGTRRSMIRLQAESLAVKYFETQPGTLAIPRTPTNAPRVIIDTFILLVSPLLPPVTMFVTPFALRSFRVPSVEEQKLLLKHPTLAIFGDKDNFTGSSKLVQWGERLQDVDRSDFHYNMIHGADHFWRSNAASTALQTTVRQWVERVVSAKESVSAQTSTPSYSPPTP